MKFSILIAVYNAADYLPRCLASLVAQTHADFEALCVDDASTDGSLDLLRDMASRDPRFRVFHQETNCGQAVARNLGLRQATGDFTLMLDADDWFAPDTLQRLASALERAPEADCAVLRLFFWYSEQRQTLWAGDVEGKTEMTGREAARLWVEGRLHGLYAVRTSLHRRHPYDTGCRLYSDDNTTLVHYYHSRRVVLTEASYFYRQHAASSTHVCSLRRFDRLQADLDLRGRIATLLPESLACYEQQRWLRVVDCYLDFYRQRRHFSRDDCRQILRSLREGWAAARPDLLSAQTRHKFGYRPLRPFWLFRLQEEVYFTLRRCLRRL